MSLILNIDTATEKAQISLSRDAVILQALYNESQNDHAAFLQPAISQLVKDTAISLNDIDAVAVTAGPGSYTGLRVGMASAKGLCYALQKPLIALNTLEVLAASALSIPSYHSIDLFCPMIDARRMEVYMGLYNRELEIVLSPATLELKTNSLEEQLLNNRIIFFGSGANKWQGICKSINVSFAAVTIMPGSMASLAEKSFYRKDFSALAYCEPIYLKEFQTGRNK